MGCWGDTAMSFLSGAWSRVTLHTTCDGMPSPASPFPRGAALREHGGRRQACMLQCFIVRLFQMLRSTFLAITKAQIETGNSHMTTRYIHLALAAALTLAAGAAVPA